MEMQLQPNRWSCLPTSFAMVMDVPLHVLLAGLEHDGSQEVFALPEPRGRQSFHIQELIHIAWALGWSTTPFEPYPIARHDNEGLHNRHVRISPDNELAVMKILQRHSGVLTGLSQHSTPHAVAWDNQSERIYNPIGEIQTLDTFSIQCFWCLARR